jgi:peptidoglycan/LPS O-acetylase OafA/YrhL
MRVELFRARNAVAVCTKWHKMNYRREIDGLRAVAVLPVILFHAGFSVFSGGYVGVDVFFVISGYLITSFLIGELEQGNFSIARFYERRARRILPALFVVMLACLPFAYMWMLPSQLKDFAQSLVAVVFFASNVLFWREDGYFAAAAELKPLLHTWSLAVEEQYYLLFPILLLVLWRFGRQRVFWSVVSIAVLSLLLSEWGWRNKPSANFYLAPTRAWELLAGSICAFMTVGKAQRSSEVFSALGLAMIVFAIFGYDENTPFPSVYALVPVVGTTLIILFAAEGTWVARLLSLRGFVGIGLISYSAYLWHQPLFAFARLRSLTEPSQALMGVLAAASLLLAWATWFWVEQAFRKRSNPLLMTQRSVFATSGAVGAVFVAVGLAGHIGKGFEWRFNNETLRYTDAASDHAAYDDCYFSASLPSQPIKKCIFSNTDGETEAILMGDSHALAISEMLGEELLKKNIGYYDVSYSGCIPLPNLDRFDSLKNSSSHLCPEFNESVFSYASSAGINTVVLTGRYPLYLLGDRYDNGEGGVESGDAAWVDLTWQSNSVWNDEERRVRVLAAYEQQIQELAKEFNVVLVYPIPEAGWNVPSYGFKHAFFNASEIALTTSYAAYTKRTREVNALFDRLVAEVPNIYGARVHEALCNNTTGRCVNADANGVYYYDDDHLSNAGARLVAPVIVEAIQEALGNDG